MTEGKDTIPYKDRKQKQTSVALKPRDLELIAWGAEYLGCSRSDFIRTSIRAYVHHLEVLARGR